MALSRGAEPPRAPTTEVAGRRRRAAAAASRPTKRVDATRGPVRGPRSFRHSVVHTVPQRGLSGCGRAHENLRSERAPADWNSFARSRWTTVSGVGDSMGTYVPFSLHPRARVRCADASAVWTRLPRPTALIAAPVSDGARTPDGRRCRRRTSRRRSPCSARCCSPRRRSARSPRSSTRPTSTASRTGRSTARRSRSGRRASPSTRSRSRTSSRSGASSSRSAAAARVAELAALVPATANVEHYARIVKETATLRGAHPGGPGDRAARPGAARRDDRARRPRRADRLRPLAAAGHGRLRAHRARCSRRASSGSRSSTRRVWTSPASRAASATSTGSPRGSSPATSSSSPPGRRWGSRRSRSASPRTSACAARRRSRCSRSRCRRPR